VTDTVLIEEMTWQDVRDAQAAGRTTAAFACGAVEQHGPHLPTGTDAYLGTALAERAARLAGNTLVAPTLRPGLSEHHMHFPGSFTVRPSTFVALLEDYCSSLARQGFERIVVFSSHGGNTDTLRAYAPTVGRALHPDCELVFAGDWFPRVTALLTEREIPLGRAGVHAGYTETSMMLAAQPALVDMERAEPGRSDDEFYLPENVGRSQMDAFIYGLQTQSPNGVLGDPVGSTADVGEELLSAAAESLAEIFRTAPSG
jgi:creatinine amidohydrolase